MTEERPPIITDEKLQDAVDFLRLNARKGAKARAERKYLEEYIPALRAKLAVECIRNGDSAAKADIEAKASEAYHKILDAYKTAVEEDEFLQWGRVGADAVLSAWQTQNANNRAMGKLQ